MQLALFIIFGLLAVAGALNLLFQRHPINSALSLVVVMMSLAVLYWSLGAEFLAAAQVIVYAGAVMVLFVFVVMLLNAGEEERTRGSRIAYIAGIPGAARHLRLLLTLYLPSQQAGPWTTPPSAATSRTPPRNIRDISHMLFTSLLLPFEVTSIPYSSSRSSAR